MASSAAGITPISERAIDRHISAVANSQGRSGLTKRFAKLRDHISSSIDSVMPNWPRTRTSQSSTAPMNTPPACATQEDLPARNSVMNPQTMTCSSGQ